MNREEEEGNIEYKLKFEDVSEDKLKKLVTQLIYRLEEGGGEAFYELGLMDDGTPIGLTDDEAKRALEVFDRIVKEAGATYKIIRKVRGQRGLIYELHVRRFKDIPPIEVSLTLLGNVDAGKSTLKGVLVANLLDDGDGLAMSQVARYLHEIKMGRSSSVSIHILGFDEDGKCVNDLVSTYDEAKVYLKSSKIIKLVDLAGHERYLRTTLRGVLGNLPDYAMLVMGANAGPIGSFKEHLGIAVALKIPVFMVVTKIDITPKEVLEQSLSKAFRILKMPGVNKVPFIIKDMNDVIIAAKHLPHGRVAPVFLISNVTGEGINLLKAFLNILPRRIDWKEKAKEDFMLYIDEKFNVTGVGLVVSGLVESGSVSVGDTLLVGPMDDGSFVETKVTSMHLNRVPINLALAGQTITLALSHLSYKDVRRGMVLLSGKSKAKAVWEFEADVRILHHPTTIKPGYEPVIHLRTIRQTAKLIKSEPETMRSGDIGKAVFRFKKRPEFIRVGDVFVFREGRTRGLGSVTSIR